MVKHNISIDFLIHSNIFKKCDMIFKFLTQDYLE